jgi:hypothetical protein
MTSPSSNAGESKPLSGYSTSTSRMSESLAESVQNLRDHLECLVAIVEDSSSHPDNRHYQVGALALQAVYAREWLSSIEAEDVRNAIAAARLPSPSVPAPLRSAAVHFDHCFHGEYQDSCKYGDADCPASHGVAPSVPVVHGEGGEQPKNHSFNLGSSGDGPESLSSANDTSRSGDRQ